MSSSESSSTAPEVAAARVVDDDVEATERGDYVVDHTADGAASVTSSER
jgi:hypothetical protein